MTKNNAINQYSEVLAVGSSATVALTSAGQPLLARVDQNASTSLTVQNDTAGTTASAGVALYAESASGGLYVYDDGHATTQWADRLVINPFSTNSGTTLGYNSSTSQTVNIVDGNGPTTRWSMTTNGERTMPTQPCFLAYNSSPDVNATGDATVVTVDFDVEIYDQNSDFASDTFTAPVTGKYLLQAIVVLSAIGTQTGSRLDIVTSNRTYSTSYGNVGVVDQGGLWQLQACVIADMDASDTASITALVSGGTKTVSILGSTPTISTWFSGSLVC